MMDVKIQQVPARHLAAIRHTGPYHEIGGAFQRLGAWAGSRGYFKPGAEMLGVYYDNPREVAPESLRSAACITAPADFAGDEDAGITTLDLAAGNCAVGVFKGPYQRLPEVYTWLFDSWMPTAGCGPVVGPCFEVYLNDPTQVAPDECLTAIYLPVV